MTFEEYTPEIISGIVTSFIDGHRESRPIKYINVMIWLDDKERIHREDGPAIQRPNGETENWNHGVKNINT